MKAAFPPVPGTLPDWNRTFKARTAQAAAAREAPACAAIGYGAARESGCSHSPGCSHRDKSTAEGSGQEVGGKVATRPARARPAQAAASRPPRARHNPLPREGSSSGDTPLPSLCPEPAACVGVTDPPPDPPTPPPPSLNFYLHLRALVSPASLRRRPGAEREPEPPLPPPPAGGKRGKGDEHPGVDSPAPRRHQEQPGAAEGSGGAEGAAGPVPAERWGEGRRDGAEAGRRQRLPLGLSTLPPPHRGTAELRAASLSHTHTHTLTPRTLRGEEPGLALPPPLRGGCAQPINPAAPGLPAAVPPGGAASPPHGGSGRWRPLGARGGRTPFRRTALPATPRRRLSPAPPPPVEGLVRSILLQSSPLVGSGRGR